MVFNVKQVSFSNFAWTMPRQCLTMNIIKMVLNMMLSKTAIKMFVKWVNVCLEVQFSLAPLNYPQIKISMLTSGMVAKNLENIGSNYASACALCRRRHLSKRSWFWDICESIVSCMLAPPDGVIPYLSHQCISALGLLNNSSEDTYPRKHQHREISYVTKYAFLSLKVHMKRQKNHVADTRPDCTVLPA